MNQLSKASRRLSLLTIGTVLAMTAVPTVSMAATTTKESPFCTNLSSVSGKVTNNLTSLENKLTSARTDREQQITANRAKWDQEIKDNRAKWDQQRQDNFAKLEAKATTDDQKAAVKTYESTILSAVATRRQAYNTAREIFRSGVNAAIATRHNTIDSQVAAFNSSANAAVAKAQASCQATPNDGPAIRTKFQADLKAARETFQNARKDDDKVGDTVKQLAATRNASFKAANMAFEATAKIARDTLKAAFKNTSI